MSCPPWCLPGRPLPLANHCVHIACQCVESCCKLSSEELHPACLLETMMTRWGCNRIADRSSTRRLAGKGEGDQQGACSEICGAARRISGSTNLPVSFAILAQLLVGSFCCTALCLSCAPIWLVPRVLLALVAIGGFARLYL